MNHYPDFSFESLDIIVTMTMNNDIRMVASITIGNQSMIIATALKTYLVIASTKDNSSTRFNSIFFFLELLQQMKKGDFHIMSIKSISLAIYCSNKLCSIGYHKIFYMQNMYGNYTKNHLKFWTFFFSF